MNLSNAYALHQELTEINDQSASDKSALSVNKAAQFFFTIATWLIYGFYGAAMYAASLWVLQSFFVANGGNYIAIIALGVFIIVFPTALSLGKHSGYNALSRNGSSRALLIWLVSYFIFSGVYLEAISSTSQQHEKSYQQAENVIAKSAPVNIIGGNSLLSTDLTSAQVKLAQCEARLKAGTEKHCQGSQARVNSLKTQMADSGKTQVAMTAAAITAQQAAKESDVDNRTLPIGKFFAALFKQSNPVGLVIASIIGSLLFEIGHVATIFSEWRLTRETRENAVVAKELMAAYYSETGKTFSPDDFQESSVLNLDELRDAGTIPDFRKGETISPDISPDIIRPAFGFIPSKNDTPQSASSSVQPPRASATVTQLTGQYLRDAIRRQSQELAARTTGSTATHASFFGNNTQVFDNANNMHTGVTTQLNGVTTQLNGVTTQHAETPLNISVLTKIATPLWNGDDSKCRWCNEALAGRKKMFCSSHHKDAYWNWKRPTSISQRTDRVI